MLKTVSTGLMAYAIVFAIQGASASAADIEIPTSDTNSSAAVKLTAVVEKTQAYEVKEIEREKEKAKIKKHTVVEDESLSDIAKKYNVTWMRLYNKNVEIESPDIINPGVELIIPEADEVLETRELPAEPEPVAIISSSSAQSQRQQPSANVPRANSQPAATRSSAPAPRGNSAGNNYSYGYCTWYVKNVRSDLPNNLGNANTWVARAAAQGFATGSAPRVGAVAMATTGYMHVAYVTGVNGDGTVNLSEMNFKGWGVVSTRTAPASAFAYIYQ